MDTGYHDTGCERCGRSPRDVRTEDLPALLAESARRWAEFLLTVADHPGGVDGLHTRPEPSTWSAVEYGCHVRDIVALTARNLELILLVDCPPLRPIDGAAMLAQGAYAAQDPAAVGQDIRFGTVELAGLIQRHERADLDRVGALDGQLVTGSTLCRVALHEMVHHLLDAREGVPLPTP